MRYFLLCCLVFNLLGCQAKPKGNVADNPYDYEKMLFEVTREDQHFYLAVSDPYRSNDLANSFSEEMETILAADKPVYGLPYVQDHTIAYYELTRDNSPALDHFYGYPAACYASQFSQEQIDTIGHQYFEENLSEYNAFYGQMGRFAAIESDAGFTGLLQRAISKLSHLGRLSGLYGRPVPKLGGLHLSRNAG